MELVALGTHYLGVEFLEIMETESTERVPGDIVALLYFTPEEDKTTAPLSITIEQAHQLYKDLKEAFE